MSVDIWNRIKNKKLKVLTLYKKELKDVFTNFGQARPKFASFGAFYELYLFCFAIGFHSNKRINLDKNIDTFNTVHEWTPDKQTILKNLITVLICTDDIRDEIDFDLALMENMDDVKIIKRVDNLIKIFEEYANGGFELLNSTYKDDPEEFYDFRSLSGFFDEILERKVYK